MGQDRSAAQPETARSRTLRDGRLGSEQRRVRDASNVRSRSLLGMSGDSSGWEESLALGDRAESDAESATSISGAGAQPSVTKKTGKRHRHRDSTQLSIVRICSFDAIDAVRADWRELYVGTESRNPYATPDWLLSWAHHFVEERDLAVLTMVRGGVLVGVAPWYVRRIGPFTRSLHLLGSGRHDSLTELPQVLAAPGETRSVLRATLAYWSQVPDEWDWIELPLLREQGWFEPEWLTGAVGAGGIIQHKTTRPAVVLPLPDDVTTLHGLFKRNLVESTHRGRNRLDRTGRPWGITSHAAEDDLQYALPVLAALHSARAGIFDRPRHPDQIAAPERLAFLSEALGAMARNGQAEILTLDVEDRAVAAQLVLRAPDATYLGMSGVDSAWWHCSPVTLLQLRAAESAVERGHAEFNLSLGPSVAKLRWSELVEQHPEFLVCGPRRTSKAVYTAFRVTAAAAAIHREAWRHRVTGTPPKSEQRNRGQ